MIQLESVVRSLETDTVFHVTKTLPMVGNVDYIHTDNTSAAPGGVVCIDKKTFDNMMDCIKLSNDAIQLIHKMASTNDKSTDRFPTDYNGLVEPQKSSLRKLLTDLKRSFKHE